MKRDDLFRGVWLSPFAFIRGRETPPDTSTTIDAQLDAALAQVAPVTPTMLNVTAFGAVGDGSADDTSVLRWRTIGDGNGSTNSVMLTGARQTVEAFF